SLVRSSNVGPRPPVTITIRSALNARRIAAVRSSRSSARVCSWVRSIPTDARPRASVETCVLIFPRKSSLPTQIRLPRGLLNSKVGLLDLRIIHQGLGRSFKDDFAGFQHIGTLSHTESLMSVLFYH